jgi:hypothetical protein
VLFVSWNPPGLKLFWNSETDRLRTHLRWVLEEELHWTNGPDFLHAFLARGAFLVHAVKCWQQRDEPSPAAITRCARASLPQDLLHLRPERLCLLGRVPHEAAKLLLGGVPSIVVPYFDGWSGEATIPYPDGPHRIPVLISVLPDHWNRKHTRRALQGWLPKERL